MRKLLCVSILLSLAACTSNFHDTNKGSQTNPAVSSTGKEGIIGGTPVNASSSLGLSTGTLIAVLNDTDPNNTEIAECTVSFLDQNIAITAAHCVTDEQTGQPLDITKFTVFFTVNLDLNSDPAGMNRTAVAAVSINPLWNTQSSDRGDLAMLRLANPTPPGYLSVDLPSHALAFLANGQNLVAGYGSQAHYTDQPSDFQLRSTDVQPLTDKSILTALVNQALAGNPPDVQQYYFNSIAAKFNNTSGSEYYTIDQRNAHGICAGDSGGPMLITSGGNQYQVGVASYVKNLDPNGEPCAELGMYTSVDYYKDWIESTFQSLRDENTLKSSPFVAVP